MKKALAIGAASLCALGFAGSVFATDITTQGDTEIEAEYTVNSSYKVTIPANIAFNDFNDDQVVSVSASDVLLEKSATLNVSMKSANGALINGENSSIPYSVAYTLGETSVDEDISNEKTYELLNVIAGTEAEDGFVTDITFTSGTKDNVTLAGKHADTLTFNVTVYKGGEMPFASNLYDDGQQHQLTDLRDGKKYWTAKIGDTIWMTQNLDYLANDNPDTMEDGIKAGNGDIYTDGFAQTTGGTDTHFSQGSYYNWNAAMSACPDGWKLPTMEQLQSTSSYVSSEGEAGFYESPFYGVRAGYVNRGTGVISDVGKSAGYWTSSLNTNGDKASFLSYNTTFKALVWLVVPLEMVYSVRCVAE